MINKFKRGEMLQEIDPFSCHLEQRKWSALKVMDIDRI